MPRVKSAQEPWLLALLFEVAQGTRSPDDAALDLLEELQEVSLHHAAVIADYFARRPAGQLAPAGEADRDTGYKAALEAVAERSVDLSAEVEAEAAEAAADFRRLDGLRGQDRLDAVSRSQRRMRSPLLVERLIDEARAILPHAPNEALDLQEAAALVAARVSLLAHGIERRQHLLNRVDAHRANTLRVLGELVAAESIWRSIHPRMKAYPGTPLDEQAELLLLESLLRTDRREFAEAERLLARAGRLYRQVGDSVGQAKALVQRGNVADYGGDSAAAIAIYHQAARLLDPAAHGKLYLMTQHNLANNLVELGRAVEGAEVMMTNRALYEAHDDPANRLRQSWLEGRLARAEERWNDAEQLLGQVRNGWLAQGMGYDAALVSLDLAELYLASGRTAKVKALARQLAPIFESRGVHREALAALVLFEKAARTERLTAELVARLRRYLLLARNDPSFRFEQASTLSPEKTVG